MSLTFWENLLCMDIKEINAHRRNYNNLNLHTTQSIQMSDTENKCKNNRIELEI